MHIFLTELLWHIFEQEEGFPASLCIGNSLHNRLMQHMKLVCLLDLDGL